MIFYTSAGRVLAAGSTSANSRDIWSYQLSAGSGEEIVALVVENGDCPGYIKHARSLEIRRHHPAEERALLTVAGSLSHGSAPICSHARPQSIVASLPKRWFATDDVGPHRGGRGLSETMLQLELFDPGRDVLIGAAPETLLGTLELNVPDLLWQNNAGGQHEAAVGGDGWHTLTLGRSSAGEVRVAWMLLDSLPSEPPSPEAWAIAACETGAAGLPLGQALFDGHGLTVQPELGHSWLLGQSHWLCVQV